MTVLSIILMRNLECLAKRADLSKFSDRGSTLLEKPKRGLASGHFSNKCWKRSAPADFSQSGFALTLSQSDRTVLSLSVLSVACYHPIYHRGDHIFCQMHRTAVQEDTCIGMEREGKTGVSEVVLHTLSNRR